ncbi:unnamed protein product [Caenorhabditis angaria]|uniref:tRNA (guanine(10)-N(2))-methyltransferase TRMT11 N-terminal domain-containing protein n=1 Tax=Caenorhabditis angaria TaxID=860376 RepID=A0A9P1I2A9_9PELO|nr:unnamed protein product [Caenorhabditis angaria]
MIKVLITFSQSHLDFRIAEFEAICEMFNISFKTAENSFNKQKHVYLIDFENLEDVKKVLSRAVLIKFAFEFIENAQNYEELYEKLGKTVENQTSFALRIFSIGRKKEIG